MQRILSSQLHAHVGESVRVAGWIHRRRLLKSVAFLILRDAAGSDPDRRHRRGRPAPSSKSLPEETTVAVTGTVDREPGRTRAASRSSNRRSRR